MQKVADFYKSFGKTAALFRVILLAFSWIVLFSSVAYADDCLRDIRRAED